MPHSYEYNNTAEQVRPGTAIVAEGGGQRGIFTAGVLDAFLRNGFNPFETGVGTSAGAQNLFTYFLGLPGYAKRAIAELSSAPSFFVPYRFLGRRCMLDLDTYFSHMLNNPEYTFPYQEIASMKKKRQLLFAATCKSSLRARYLEPQANNIVECMKASSAIPFLYKEGVQFGDNTLVDGGVADPLPVRKAYDQGARDIVVIRTVPQTHRSSCWRRRIDSLKLGKALPHAIRDMLEIHEHTYNKALDFLDNSPPDANITIIAPVEPLKSSLLGSRSDALITDYSTGCRAGTKALDKLYHWQSKSRTLSKCVG